MKSFSIVSLINKGYIVNKDYEKKVKKMQKIESYHIYGEGLKQPTN